MARGWIAIGAGALLSAALAAALTARVTQDPRMSPGNGEERRAQEAPPTRADFDELLAALEFERHARVALAEEVAALRRALEEAQPVGRLSASRAPLARPDADAAREAPQESAAAQADAASAAAESGFDTGALVRAGLADADAERLHARWEAFELEKLEVNHVGLREGWRGKRFRQEHRALEAALRLELEDEWDAYLYATSRENRVRVNSVLSDSPAFAAGFAEGDMIVSYDTQRVYNPNELQGRTAACPEGAYVGVDVVRDGRLETLRAPCGPLGVLVDHVKQPPLLD